MENFIDLTLSPDHQDQNSPKITARSHRKGPLDDKEVNPGDGSVPAAERVEKGNAGGDQGASQSLTRKRAREAGEEGSGKNQGGGKGGDHLLVEGPVTLNPCPGQDRGKVLDSKRDLFRHLNVYVKRSRRGSSSRPLVSREEGKGEDKEEKGGEGGKAPAADTRGGKVALPNDNEPAADTRGEAIAEAPKDAGMDVDLNVEQFLLPDLNLPPPPDHWD